MTLRTKFLVWVVVAGATASLYLSQGVPARNWIHFLVYLLVIILSSGMKITMLKTDATMSVNFPFILLGVIQLSPLQAIALAVAGVVAQCRFKVVKPFTAVQILFNVANVIIATALASITFEESLPRIRYEVAPSLAIAATVYFFANTIPLTFVLGWESGSSPFRKWREEFPWYYPFYPAGAVLAATSNWVGDRFGWLTSMLLIPMVYIVYRAYSAQKAIIRDRERHIIEIEALHLRTIEALAMAIEAKDVNTHEHLARVRVYVSGMGEIMGLDEAQMKALVTASYLHDIGKLAVPESIINKPGRLNPAEFEKIKIHPVVGAEIIERIKFPCPVVPIVRSHHEAWDGSGYPDGLKGEEIPLGARILTAVDCFDALTTERPYRKAMRIDEAMAFLKSRAGSQFDPEIVRLLDEHHSGLEQRVHRAMDEMAHLNIDLRIERGAAPGAGFATEDSVQMSPGQADENEQENYTVAAMREMLKAAGATGSGYGFIAQRLQFLVPFNCFAIYRRSGDFLIVESIEGHCDGAFSKKPIPIGQGPSGWVAENVRSIVNGNPTVEPNFLASSGLFTEASSALSIPLLNSQNDLVGVLTLYACAPKAFSRGHLRILEEIGPELALTLGEHRKSKMILPPRNEPSQFEVGSTRTC